MFKGKIEYYTTQHEKFCFSGTSFHNLFLLFVIAFFIGVTNDRVKINHKGISRLNVVGQVYGKILIDYERKISDAGIIGSEQVIVL